MLSNRSIPNCTVIPELAYVGLTEAIDWLQGAFDFTLRLRIGDHRAQLAVGDGAIVLMQRGAPMAAESGDVTHSVMVRVEDIDSHHARAQRHGARILRPPTDYPYGERQYTAEDLGGHRWTFSQSIADVAPEDWGGQSGSGL